MTHFQFRPATELDYELMWTIQRTSIGPYVDATFGSTEEPQRAFFDEHFDHQDFKIVQIEGRDAGFLSYEVRDTHLFLGNLALLPEFQNRGIGAEIVGHIISEAEGEELPVRLQVLRSNPARQFYERLGFSCYKETETQSSRALHRIGRGSGCKNAFRLGARS